MKNLREFCGGGLQPGDSFDENAGFADFTPAGVSMDQDWYYGEGDDNIGPLPFEELIAALRAKPDWKTIPVWCSAFDDWRRAGDVRQIALRLAATQAHAAPRAAARPSPKPAAPPQPAPLATRAQEQNGQRPFGLKAERSRLRLLLIAGAAALAGVAVIVALLMFSPFTPPLERAFAQIVAQTKPALPRKADDAISLTDVSYAGTKLTYHHVWDGPRFAIPNNLGGLMRARKLAEICATAKEIFALGGTVEYTYRSQSGLFIANFEVKKEDCG